MTLVKILKPKFYPAFSSKGSQTLRVVRVEWNISTKNIFICMHYYLPSDSSLPELPVACSVKGFLRATTQHELLAMLTQMMTSCCRNPSASRWDYTSVTEGHCHRRIQATQSRRHRPNELSEHFTIIRTAGGLCPEWPSSLPTSDIWGQSLSAPKRQQISTSEQSLSLAAVNTMCSLQYKAHLFIRRQFVNLTGTTVNYKAS